MTKKIAIVGGAGQVAAAVAHDMLRNPGHVVCLDELLLADQEAHEFMQGLVLKEMSPSATKFFIQNKETDAEVALKQDVLPKAAKKPKFLLEQNHNIRGFRR